MNEKERGNNDKDAPKSGGSETAYIAAELSHLINEYILLKLSSPYPHFMHICVMI